MSHRTWWLIIAALALLGVVIALQDGVSRQPATDDDAPARSAGTRPAADPTPRTAPDADTGARVADAAALREAVETLHGYFPLLFRDDTADADALWVGGRPAAHGEADLRVLEGVTGLRVDNAPPEALDTASAPGAVRVPVRLRIGAQGPLRHYTGHYDLRRGANGWRIVAASIERSPEPG